MAKSNINWTEQTWNPVSGCSKISPGCQNCYAEKMAKRLQAMGQKKYENCFDVTLHPECLDEPLKVKKPTIFFVCSMGDLFHEDVPVDFINEVYDVMVRCPQSTFIVLTKRAAAMMMYIKFAITEDSKHTPVWTQRCTDEDGCFKFPSNIYHGVTVCNQDEADQKIPHLLQVPGKRFLSIEPMLGPIDLQNYLNLNPGIDQIILGGESGPNARPMHPDWVRSMKDKCLLSGTAFMFKQWGEWAPGEVDRSNGYRYTSDGRTVAFAKYRSPRRMSFDSEDPHSGSVCSWRVGKKKAGRTLDGQLHDDLIWKDGGA